MKRVTALVALLATSCASMEPAYVRPNPSIPASWPAGDPYLRQSEATLPAVTYQLIFRDALSCDSYQEGFGRSYMHERLSLTL